MDNLSLVIAVIIVTLAANVLIERAPLMPTPKASGQVLISVAALLYLLHVFHHI